MPAEHLRALINELHPGVSVRQLTLAAGLDLNRIAYYLRPSTDIDSIPCADTIKDIARALHCDQEVVVEAFAVDAGIPLPKAPQPDPAEEHLLRLYRRTTLGHRESLTRALADRDTRELVLRYLQLSQVDQMALEQIARSLTGNTPLEHPEPAQGSRRKPRAT